MVDDRGMVGGIQGNVGEVAASAPVHLIGLPEPLLMAGVLEGLVGLVVIADVRRTLRVQGDGRVAPHAPGGVDDGHRPRSLDVVHVMQLGVGALIACHMHLPVTVHRDG
ncbi:hypothetical protein DSECCO2_621310 [anaerobic digester metagenome]